MSERLGNALLVALMIVMGVVLAVMISTQPVDVDRVAQIGARIRCPVCQGESIADSPAPMARDMMALIAEKVDGGATDEQIIDDLLSSYSGAILLDPPLSGATLWLWVAPLVAVTVGIGVIVWWRRHPTPSAITPSSPRSKKRILIGGALLVALFAIIVGVAGNFLQEREGATAGVADLTAEDLADVSNETMEAVIAANLDNAAINGMRLALAERYYEEGDYRAAFPHYLAVAESTEATNVEAAAALTRLGWMAYEGNGEVETAIRLLDQALAIEPGSPVALYLKGRVKWCGAGDAETAALLFEEVLDNPALPDASRSEIEADLERVSSGAACT
ncbi:MAG TPA: cytochrome c-type biogenesis protein CcmH [Acidimicrobiia bacterium]|nr:cytochrome c-type biogenesis protein CcmH [Acidimicrobiia bacterium]